MPQARQERRPDGQVINHLPAHRNATDAILGLPFWQPDPKRGKTMPDRSDANQEGINLPPINHTRLLAEAAAHQVVMEHIRLCPLAADNISQRLRTLEISFGRLIGFMFGSGLLGGASGALISKIIH